MSALVKISGPGQRRAKRLQQILSQRDAAHARIETEFWARVKALAEEEEAVGTGGVVEAEMGSETTAH